MGKQHKQNVLGSNICTIFSKNTYSEEISRLMLNNNPINIYF